MQEPNPQAANTHYETGRRLFLTGKYTEASEYFELAAKSNHPAACMYLFLMYRNSIGVIPNDDTCNHFHRLMLENMDSLNCNIPGKSYSYFADIQSDFGDLHSPEIGYKKDPKKAFTFYKIAADLGHPDAQNGLGLLYQYGRGVKKNLKEAFKYYGQAKSAYAWENMGIAFLKEDATFDDLPSDLKKELKSHIKAKAPANFYCAVECFKKAKKLTKNENLLYEINKNLTRAENRLKEVIAAQAHQAEGVQTRGQKRKTAGVSEQPQKIQRLDENGKSKDKKPVDARKEIIQDQQRDQTEGVQTRAQKKRESTEVSEQPQKKQRLDENGKSKDKKTPVALSMANRRELAFRIQATTQFGIFGNQKKQPIKAIVIDPSEMAITPPFSGAG